MAPMNEVCSVATWGLPDPDDHDRIFLIAVGCVKKSQTGNERQHFQLCMHRQGFAVTVSLHEADHSVLELSQRKDEKNYHDQHKCCLGTRGWKDHRNSDLCKPLLHDPHINEEASYSGIQ